MLLYFAEFCSNDIAKRELSMKLFIFVFPNLSLFQSIHHFPSKYASYLDLQSLTHEQPKTSSNNYNTTTET